MHLGFIRALLAEVVGKRTGILEVRTDDSKTRLYLLDGVVVWADQGTVGETLGRILTREKIINEASYERVLEAMARARQDGKPSRFGEIVVELGILQPTQVDAALAAQVQHKVLNCLKWEDVTFTFTAKESLGELRAFPIQIEPLLLRAMRLIDHEQKLALLGEHGHSKVELLTDAAKLGVLLRLKTPEARFVRSIDGSLATEMLLGAEVPDSVDPELLLCVLSLTGHVRFVEPTEEEKQWIPQGAMVERRRREDAPPSTKRGRRRSALRSCYEKLSSSERGRIKRAAQRLRTRGGSAAEGRPQAVSSARISLPTADAAVLVAEQQYRHGRKMLRENRVADAVVAFKRAVDLEPAAIEYRLYAAWASFRELPEKENERLAALRAITQRALKENGDFGFAYYVLSHLAAREGNKEQAEALLGRARKLDPDSIEGEKPLRIAKGQPPRAPPLPPKRSAAGADQKPAGAVALAAPMTAKIEVATHDRAAPAPGAPPPAPKPPPPKPKPAVSTDSKGGMPASEPVLPSRPRPPPSAPESGAWLTEGAAAPASQSAISARKKPRAIVGPAVLVGLVIGVAVGLVALGGGSSDNGDVHTPTTPSQMTTAPKHAATTPTTTTTPSTTTSTAPSASTSTPVFPSPSTTASAAPSTLPSTLPAASASASTSAGTGILVAPSYSQGRRVFVDGKSIGEGPGELQAPCGSHQVQIGSAGKLKTVDIPCGGKLEL